MSSGTPLIDPRTGAVRGRASCGGSQEVAAAVASARAALPAWVWTGSAGSGLSLAARLDVGEVWVNCHLEQTAELSHGGRRQSGHGTDLSVLALAEYQRPKTVTVRLD